MKYASNYFLGLTIERIPLLIPMSEKNQPLQEIEEFSMRDYEKRMFDLYTDLDTEILKTSHASNTTITLGCDESNKDMSSNATIVLGYDESKEIFNDHSGSFTQMLDVHIGGKN